MTEGAEFVMSQKNKMLLCYMGYVYTQEKQIGLKVFWKCSKYYSNKCYGRATTQETTVISVKEHNHPPNITEIEVRDALENIKEASTSTNKPTTQILKEQLLKVPQHASGQLPSIASLKRTIARQKKATTTTIPAPKTFAEVVIPPELSITHSKEPFIFFDNKCPDKRIIMFATANNLLKLQQCDTWMMDGTFKVCPKPFYQLYTIHGLGDRLPIAVRVVPTLQQRHIH